MKDIRSETKPSSLIHQKIRNASFIPLGSHDAEKFKYNIRFELSKYFNDRLIALKNTCKKIISKPRLWTQEIDFKTIRNDTASWLVEALIEGFVMNFIVWALLDWSFSLVTMMAWGFAIKQLLSIYWRLKKDGSNSKIPQKDK